MEPLSTTAGLTELDYRARVEYKHRMIRIDRESGLIPDARQVPSPNCDARPPDCEPELVVVHGISLPPGEFGGDWIDQFFTNNLDPAAHPYFREIAEMRVSSHLLVRRDGELVQYVPLSKRAWHAGESCYRDRERCNDYSIGIELEGVDTVDYSDAQYDALGHVIDALQDAIPSLAGAPVVGHSDIAPGRKTDPGPAFDWQRFETVLADQSSNRTSGAVT
jgi:AmpD protein